MKKIIWNIVFVIIILLPIYWFSFDIPRTWLIWEWILNWNPDDTSGSNKKWSPFRVNWINIESTLPNYDPSKLQPMVWDPENENEMEVADFTSRYSYIYLWAWRGNINNDGFVLAPLTFTLSLWINPSTTQMENAVIYNWWSYESKIYHWSEYKGLFSRWWKIEQDGLNTNKYAFSIPKDLNTPGYNKLFFDLKPDKWTNITVQFNYETKLASIYINWSIHSNETFNDTLEENLFYASGWPHRIWMWKSFWTTIGWKISSVRLYNKALSDSEILQMHDKEKSIFGINTPPKIHLSESVSLIKEKNQDINFKIIDPDSKVLSSIYSTF